jgi:hypothetical protein
MHLYERRESDLGPKLWPRAELETDPAVVERYEEAPDLPGPIQAAGTADGPATKAWCPQCQEVITEACLDNIIAASPIEVLAPPTMWPGHRTIAMLITLTPCGHAFRVVHGQTIAEVREPAA